MKLIQELEDYRLEHRISQEELAKKLGVHYLTVHRWLMGIKKPNVIHEYHIKKFLDTNREEVIDQEFIKRQTKNGQFFHASSSWEEHDKVNIEYNKSIPPAQRITGTNYLRDMFYKIKNIKKEPFDKTVYGTIRKEDLYKREMEDTQYYKKLM